MLSFIQHESTMCMILGTLRIRNSLIQKLISFVLTNENYTSDTLKIFLSRDNGDCFLW